MQSLRLIPPHDFNHSYFPTTTWTDYFGSKTVFDTLVWQCTQTDSTLTEHDCHYKGRHIDSRHKMNHSVKVVISQGFQCERTYAKHTNCGFIAPCLRTSFASFRFMQRYASIAIVKKISSSDMHKLRLRIKNHRLLCMGTTTPLLLLWNRSAVEFAF